MKTLIVSFVIWIFVVPVAVSVFLISMFLAAHSPDLYFTFAPLALALCLAAAPAVVRADDTIDNKLDATTLFGPSRSANMDEVLSGMSKVIDVPIKVDDEAFRREKVVFDGKKYAHVPRATLRNRTALEYLLGQVDARYELRGKTIMVIPMTRDGKELTFPPPKAKSSLGML